MIRFEACLISIKTIIIFLHISIKTLIIFFTANDENTQKLLERLWFDVFVLYNKTEVN